MATGGGTEKLRSIPAGKSGCSQRVRLARFSAPLARFLQNRTPLCRF